MTDGFENCYTKYVRQCEDCPLYVDPDPYPSRCEHPRGGEGSYLIKGDGNCPLMVGVFVLKIHQD